MTKIKRFLSAFICLCAVATTCVCMAGMSAAVSAPAPAVNIRSKGHGLAALNNKGLFTTLSISLNGGDGKVRTTVKNDFTLFYSTVRVIVQLYASDTYQEDYHDMELIWQNSTIDLDMGVTVTAEASTGGRQRYWIGRMRYSINAGGWEERTVGPLLYSAEGKYSGVL